MIRDNHSATLAGTVIVSLAIGFGAATLLPRPTVRVEPIIDENAWQETAAVSPNTQPISTSARPARAGACSPWEISDVAMEEMLDEMIRRGWRPPNQGAAIAAMDLAQTVGLSATNPNAPMPYRSSGLLSDLLVGEEGDDLDEPESEAQPGEPPAPPATSDLPAPPPA